MTQEQLDETILQMQKFKEEVFKRKDSKQYCLRFLVESGIVNKTDLLKRYIETI